MKARPPHPEREQELVHELEEVDIPDEAIPYLRPLAYMKDSALSGWALAELIPAMSRDEFKGLLKRVAHGDIGWNEWNFAGYALGQRLDATLIPEFKRALREAQLVPEAEEDKAENHMARNRAHAFAEAIGGMESELRSDILR